MKTQIIRQRYTVSELIESNRYTIFNFGSESYAVENSDYVSCVVSNPYYKWHNGNYCRCYADVEPLQMILRTEKTKEWF